ncbi:hypothetical protein FACS1894154_04900 [Betaproteobacteria bacterium]|nr:hypothetical protein FACS1894154_04900 [Betaproteobacteria bacterium]GHU24223.1 hypothetical protein FACS189488_08410 [Betaproteobacteria bacterium]
MPRFLVTRGVVSAVAILIAIVEGNFYHLVMVVVGLYTVLMIFGGPKVSVSLLGATFVVAAPLVLVHGVINPAYPVSHNLLGIPLHADGVRYAVELSTRLTLLFGVFGLWIGTPRRTWIALIAASRIPPAWGVTILQAIALTKVLAVRITRIRQAQRSRGILRDNMGFFARAGATVAVIVPLIAVTLIDAAERGALLHRMGFGSYPLHPATPLDALEPLDLVLSLVVVIAITILLLV